jgi:signal transduction histidine kinase
MNRLVAGMHEVGGYLPHGRTLPEPTWRRRHVGMVALLWAHVVALPIVGLFYGYSVPHALLEGGIVAGFGILALLKVGDRRTQSVVVALGLLTCSAVLVHITGGLIEAHFHFFVMVGVLSLYEDWIPFLVSISYVLLQHGIAAAFIDRASVFNHPGSAWHWAAIHSLFIAALSIACVINWRESERQREAVREFGQRQQSLLDALEEGVVLIGRDGTIVEANPSAQRLLGIATGDGAIHARDPRWSLLQRDGTPMPEQERPTLVTATTGRSVSGVELGLRQAGGDLRWLSVSTRALPDGPNDRGPYPVVLSFADMTARRRAVEGLERSNAELAEFAYVASHDLSEPLRMISSYLQLLRRRHGGRLGDEADEYIGHAVDGAGRMRALIDGLLAYSRAGRGPGGEPVDCGAVVEDVLRGLATAVAEAKATVTVGELPTVPGDRVQLGQLFQNVIANGLKFRRGDSVHVSVTAEQHDGAWLFEVRDDGIGIDTRHRERVFGMFQRLHGRDAYEGTGIGLSICRKIVGRHGGRIWLDGREGAGTVVSFTLPVLATGSEAPAERAPAVV